MKAVVPVIEYNGEIIAKIDASYVCLPYATYINCQRHYFFYAQSKFKYPCNSTFESSLSVQYKIDNMWRDDLLSYWYWQKRKTGISSAYERLDALELAASLLLRGKPDYELFKTFSK